MKVQRKCKKNLLETAKLCFGIAVIFADLDKYLDILVNALAAFSKLRVQLKIKKAKVKTNILNFRKHYF